jgi:hypothetical protein
VNAGLIVTAIGVVGAVVILAMPRLRRHQAVDLGTVSDQWIAEQRFGQGNDPQR